MPMEVMRIRNVIKLEFDEEGARAMNAVLNNRPDLVSPEQFARGQFFYQAFFVHVQELATNYPVATGEKRAHP